MIETLRKAVLTSLGAAALTKEKVEKTVAELTKRGELTAEQGRKIVDELAEAGEKEQAEIAETVAKAVSDALDRMDLARKSDLKALEERVAALEQQTE